MLLSLEDVEQAEADAAANAEENAAAERAARAQKRRVNRGSLPPHLPRIETAVGIDGKTCLCCKGALHKVGEDVSERLDIVPAQFRVIVVRRPKYACRSCENSVVQAQAPARLSKAAFRSRPWPSKSSFRKTPITRLFIVKRKSRPAQGSTSTARH